MTSPIGPAAHLTTHHGTADVATSRSRLTTRSLRVVGGSANAGYLLSSGTAGHGYRAARAAPASRA